MPPLTSYLSASPLTDGTTDSDCTGSFNSCAVQCSAGKCMVGDIDRDERMPLAESIAMMRKIVFTTCAGVVAKPDLLAQSAERRVRFVRNTDSHQGIICDPVVAHTIDELGRDIPESLRGKLENLLLSAVCEKHSHDFRQADAIMSPQTVRPPLFDQTMEALSKVFSHLTAAFKAKNSEDIKVHLSNLDTLFSMINDFVRLIHLRPCAKSLSLARFVNLTSYAKAEMAVVQIKAPSVDEKNAAEMLAHSGKVVVVSVKFQNTDVDRSIVRLAREVCSYWEVVLETCGSITKSSAAALKSYLSDLGIDRLYFPMAGCGYFARMMMDEELPVTCVDGTPGEKTFIKVKKSKILEGIQQFCAALITANQSIASTVLTLQAPPPMFLNLEVYETAGRLLPNVAKRWFEHGGSYLLVVSDVADINTLFCPKMLRALGIRLAPVLPGFGPDIYMGLGCCIGVCGVFSICATNQSMSR